MKHNRMIKDYVAVVVSVQKYYCPKCRIQIELEKEKNSRECPVCKRNILQHINKDKTFKYHKREKSRKLTEW